MSMTAEACRSVRPKPLINSETRMKWPMRSERGITTFETVLRRGDPLPSVDDGGARHLEARAELILPVWSLLLCVALVLPGVLWAEGGTSRSAESPGDEVVRPAAAVLQGPAEKPHPLDPLTAQEIRRIVATLVREGKASEEAVYGEIRLHEPDKSAVLSRRAVPREAFAAVYDYGADRLHEAVVDLETERVVSWRHVPGAQPQGLPQDDSLATKILREDPQVREALARRGIEEVNEVRAVAYVLGDFAPEGERGRLVTAFLVYEGEEDVEYSLDEIWAWLNLTTGEVLQVTDGGMVRAASEDYFFDPERLDVDKLRPAQLWMEQPEGRGFDVDGREVRWGKWRFRFGHNGREGLVLYTVRYADEGEERPIMYRGALSEMMVPYGDTAVGWYFRNIFDAGDAGMLFYDPTSHSPRQSTSTR